MDHRSVAEICRFLEARKIAKPIVDYFREQKMDSVAVSSCTDKKLEEIGIKTFGDKIALRGFAIQKGSNQLDQDAKRDLIRSIRNRQSPIFKKGNDNLKLIKVHIGWKHFNIQSQTYTSLRKVGGSREIHLSRESNFSEILQNITDLYFPTGDNLTMGRLEHYICEIGNFSGSPVSHPDGVTLEAYINENRLKHVRLYLLTKSKGSMLTKSKGPMQTEKVKKTPNKIVKDILSDIDTFSDSDDFELPELPKIPVSKEMTSNSESSAGVTISYVSKTIICNSCNSTKYENEPCLKCSQNEDFEKSLASDIKKRREDDREGSELPKDKIVDIDNEVSFRFNKNFNEDVIRNNRRARLVDEPPISEPHNVVMIRHPVLGSLTRICKPELTYAQIYLWIGSMKETPLNFYLKDNPMNIISPMLKITEPLLLFLEETCEVAFKNYFGDDFLYIPQQPGDNGKQSTALLDVLQSKRANIRGERFMDSLAAPKTCLEVSRHNIIHDLFEIYNTNDNEKIVAIRFTEEDAYGEGVTREVYSVFFKEISFSRSSGLNATVPINFSENEAKLFGRILTNAFIQTNFFPVNFSKALFEYLLYKTVRDKVLLESFYKYLERNEATLFRRFIGQEEMSKVEINVVWNLLSDCTCTSIPSYKNIYDLTLQAAKHVFIEKPCFILMNMKLGLGDFWENISTATIDTLWNIYTPNVDNVLSYLLIESSTPMEERTELYMQRYIRSLSSDQLSIFVQFCTGSTTIDPGTQIKVTFENQDPRSLYLRSSACFKILYCPRNVSCYKQFRTICDRTLLNPCLWAMDDMVVPESLET